MIQLSEKYEFPISVNNLIFYNNLHFLQIPVFLSKNLLRKLYVFQYPLRSVAVEMDKPNVIAVSTFLQLL